MYRSHVCHADSTYLTLITAIINVHAGDGPVWGSKSVSPSGPVARIERLHGTPPSRYPVRTDAYHGSSETIRRRDTPPLSLAGAHRIPSGRLARTAGRGRTHAGGGTSGVGATLRPGPPGHRVPHRHGHGPGAGRGTEAGSGTTARTTLRRMERDPDSPLSPELAREVAHLGPAPTRSSDPRWKGCRRRSPSWKWRRQGLRQGDTWARLATSAKSSPATTARRRIVATSMGMR